MSVTSGFFNSKNGDRKYFATDISSIFDGVIVDGVFATIGDAFNPISVGNFVVNIGTGKGWFNHSWILNNAILPITLDSPEQVLDRIDAIVLDINGDESVRNNSIIIVKGIPSSEPKPPKMASDIKHHQYPICYINRKASSTKIVQADITNKIGSPETPFVLGVLKTIDLTTLLGQWESQLDEFVKREESEFDSWQATEQSEFLEWFNNIRGQLGSDPAGALQNQIDVIKASDVIVHDLELVHGSWIKYSPADNIEQNLFNMGYEYRITVPVHNVNKNMTPYVTLELFSVDESGVSIANQFSTYGEIDGGVYIYADGQPSSNIKVLTIECRKDAV